MALIRLDANSNGMSLCSVMPHLSGGSIGVSYSLRYSSLRGERLGRAKANYNNVLSGVTQGHQGHITNTPRAPKVWSF